MDKEKETEDLGEKGKENEKLDKEPKKEMDKINIKDNLVSSSNKLA